MNAVEDFRQRIRDLDARIAPLIWRVDLSGPDWKERVKAEAEQRRAEGYELSVPVLDRAGLRADAEALLSAVLAFYVQASAENREVVRALFREYHAFAWAIGGARAVAIPEPAGISVERCRDCLAWFAIDDQGSDPRDAILWLQKLCRVAEAGGLPLADSLTEAAERASDTARFAKVGGSSTRALLLDYARRFARPFSSGGGTF